MNLSADGKERDNARKRRSDVALPNIATGQQSVENGALEFSLKFKKGPDSIEKETINANDSLSPNGISPRFVFIETTDDEDDSKTKAKKAVSKETVLNGDLNPVPDYILNLSHQCSATNSRTNKSYVKLMNLADTANSSKNVSRPNLVSDPSDQE